VERGEQHGGAEGITPLGDQKGSKGMDAASAGF